MIHLVSSMGNRFLNYASSVLLFSLVALCANSYSFASRLIEPVSVSSQVMRFPGIPLDGIHYDALQFAYATDGALAVTDVYQRSEPLLCDGQRQNSTYLEVHFAGPQIVFQIRDLRTARVLLRQPWKIETSTTFGQGQCHSSADVTARFERQRQAWERLTQKRILERAVQEMQEYMQNDAVLRLETVDLTLFKLVNQKRFSDAAEAFSMAASALSDYQQFGPTVDGGDLLFDAAQKWEAVLSQVNGNVRQQPELQEVKRALHRNLVAVYLVTGRYELARKHDALALHAGMPERDSMQPRILDYEKRRILSPIAAKDMALTANLYRFGQNAVAQAQLVEMDSLAKLDMQLRGRGL